MVQFNSQPILLDRSRAIIIQPSCRGAGAINEITFFFFFFSTVVASFALDLRERGKVQMIYLISSANTDP